jgi:hypothetical protein
MTDASEQVPPEQANQDPVLRADQQERLRRLFRLVSTQPEGRYLFDLMCRYRANQPHA